MKLTKVRKSEKIIFLFLFVFTITVHSQVFWNECISPVTTALRCVSNIDANNAWICGASGVVIKTTNGGYNWTNVSGNGIPNTVLLINIYGVNSNLALTAGYTGTTTFVYRTTNGGANWTQVFTETNGFINAVWMLNTTDGFMQGDPVSTRWSIWKTTNGGVNWDSTGLYLPKAGVEAGWNSSLWMIDYAIWFGTNNSRIYYSSDFGASWVVQPTSPEINSYTIALNLNTQVIGLTGGATLLKTTNAGQNWNQVTTPSTGNFTGVAIIQSFVNSWWYVRGSTSIYYSPISVNNWQIQYTAPAGTFNHISLSRTVIFGPGMLYAVRSNGGITRGNLFIEGVKIISNEIPSGFKLFQNYPNPFNPQTKIKFYLPNLKILNPGEVRGALIRIKVYDLLGREIETLVDQITQPGVYEDTWDGSNYPSGIYYYHFSVIDPKYNTVEFSETKKMVLIK